MRVECQPVFIQVGVQILSAKDLGNLDELIVIVATLEEWFSLKDHARKHAAEGPDIERVVVGLHINEELGALEVAASYAHIVLLARMVELSQAPVDKAELAVGVVNHDIVRFYIAVHDALAVAVVERFQDFKHIKADVEVIEALIKFAEIGVASVHELSDDSWCLGQGVTSDTDHVDDVSSAL